MTVTLLAPYSLQQFQNQFGDYLRSQYHAKDDGIPSRVGGIYQTLIFNNVRNFLNQCFPICREILGDDNFHVLSLYFFQRYPSHSPYFNEIPMQFVNFLSQLMTDSPDWHDEITITNNDIDFVPDYLSELAHYEWLELHVDTLANLTARPILKTPDNQSYGLNPSVQNSHYTYPVHAISVDNCNDIAPDEVFLVVLRASDNEVKFVHTNALTHLFIDFIQNNERVYSSVGELVTDFAKHIDYHNIDELLAYADDLFAELLAQNIII
ncbi:MULTISPECIES: DUF2063 domain-containing protein [unclassified Moraxella]|uniref:HvfC family RiPP maturation protein n=1 Tax=unclassified Moraxella TaxID=2685852 RepID=UPI00359CD5C8